MKKKEEHWWIKDKPFKRVGLTTLTRLALLYQGKTGKSVSEFILWLEDEEYMTDRV